MYFGPIFGSTSTPASSFRLHLLLQVRSRRAAAPRNRIRVLRRVRRQIHRLSRLLRVSPIGIHRSLRRSRVRRRVIVAGRLNRLLDNDRLRLRRVDGELGGLGDVADLRSWWVLFPGVDVVEGEENLRGLMGGLDRPAKKNHTNRHNSYLNHSKDYHEDSGPFIAGIVVLRR